MTLAKKAGTIELTFALAPMQFSDGPKVQLKDTQKLFKKFKGFNIIGGTEAAEDPLKTLLRQGAQSKARRYVQNASVWLAIDETIMSPRGYSTGFVPVLRANEGFGRHGVRGILWVTFTHVVTGDVITVAQGHSLTHASNPKAPNWKLNLKYAGAVEALRKQKTKGGGLFFYMADTNTNDRKYDVFHGGKMTSCWDELGKWPTTVEDNATIDVIASSDNNQRVKCKEARVINDDEMHFFFDHFVSTATYTIRSRSKLQLP